MITRRYDDVNYVLVHDAGAFVSVGDVLQRSGPTSEMSFVRVIDTSTDYVPWNMFSTTIVDPEGNDIGSPYKLSWCRFYGVSWLPLEEA